MFLSSLASGREYAVQGTKTLGALASKAMCPSHNECVQLHLALNDDQLLLNCWRANARWPRYCKRDMLPVKLASRGPPLG